MYDFWLGYARSGDALHSGVKRDQVWWSGSGIFKSENVALHLFSWQGELEITGPVHSSKQNGSVRRFHVKSPWSCSPASWSASPRSTRYNLKWLFFIYLLWCVWNYIYALFLDSVINSENACTPCTPKTDDIDPREADSLLAAGAHSLSVHICYY